MSCSCGQEIENKSTCSFFLLWMFRPQFHWFIFFISNLPFTCYSIHCVLLFFLSSLRSLIIIMYSFVTLLPIQLVSLPISVASFLPDYVREDIVSFEGIPPTVIFVCPGVEVFRCRRKYLKTKDPFLTLKVQVLTLNHFLFRSRWKHVKGVHEETNKICFQVLIHL